MGLSLVAFRLDRNEKYWKLLLYECCSSSSVQLVSALTPLTLNLIMSVHCFLCFSLCVDVVFVFLSPPLTQFFLDCSGLVQTDKKPALCKSYQKLISELWHKKRYIYKTNLSDCLL